MPRSDPSVSVVVCAFTPARAAQLERAVASLGEQARPPEEIIVVIDHCPPLLAWARARLPAVTVLDHRGPPGLSGARNTGVASARGDVVAFLDDDAVAEPDWLARLLAVYDDPRVVGAGGAVLPDWEAGRAPRWLPSEFLWVVGCSYRGQPRSAGPVRNVLGAGMSFRREAIVAAGGFAPGLGRLGSRPLGCEETDLCIRLAPLGRVHYDPAARVRHRVPRERATLRYFVARCHAEGISKSAVARRVGRGPGLASERAYVARTLPAGVRRALAGGELARAGAIVAGLGATAAGYLRSGT